MFSNKLSSDVRLHYMNIYSQIENMNTTIIILYCLFEFPLIYLTFGALEQWRIYQGTRHICFYRAQQLRGPPPPRVMCQLSGPQYREGKGGNCLAPSPPSSLPQFLSISPRDSQHMGNLDICKYNNIKVLRN